MRYFDAALVLFLAFSVVFQGAYPIVRLEPKPKTSVVTNDQKSSTPVARQPWHSRGGDVPAVGDSEGREPEDEHARENYNENHES